MPHAFQCSQVLFYEYVTTNFGVLLRDWAMVESCLNAEG